MHYLQLAKHLFNTNKDVVKKTAIRDCHCLGLHSFIINEKPRIRLFIAEDDSELHGKKVIIPIHSHKYDDLFQVVSGEVIHKLYLEGNVGQPYNTYLYPRIKEGDSTPLLCGLRYLEFVGTIKSKSFIMPASTLHTVQLKGQNVMWMVTELAEDTNFKQIGYVPYNSKLEIRDELYKPFPGALEYITDRFKKIDERSVSE